MAIEFEEQPVKKREVVAPAGGKHPSLDAKELAAKIEKLQRQTERLIDENDSLRQNIKEVIDQNELLMQKAESLIGFFENHEAAIHTSIYATSKHAIEKESAIAISEIQRAGEMAREQINQLVQVEQSKRKPSFWPKS